MFANYTVLERIGEGGCGEVFQALDRHGRAVAIKVLHRDLSRDARVERRFRREARVLGGLDHPSVPRVFEVGSHEGRPAFAMELCQGFDLRRRFHGERAPWRLVAHIGAEVARALDHAHARGVVHRDIKPANIMLDDASRVFVLDFGIAYCVHETRITRATALGTDAYMAPEAITKAPVPASDLYSLGVTLFELVTGELPRRRGIAGEPALQERVSSVRERVGEVPAGFDRLLCALLRSEPLLRPPTAREVAERLEHMLDGAPEDPVSARLTSIVEAARAKLLALEARRTELTRALEDAVSDGEEEARRVREALAEIDQNARSAQREFDQRAEAIEAALRRVKGS